MHTYINHIHTHSKLHMYNHDCTFVNTYVFIYVCTHRTRARRSQSCTFTYINT